MAWYDAYNPITKAKNLYQDIASGNYKSAAIGAGGWLAGLPELGVSEYLRTGVAQAAEPSGGGITNYGDQNVYPDMQPTSPSGSSGSETGGTEEPVYVPNNQIFLGQTYDLNSPEGLSQYLQAKKDYIDATNKDLLAQIDKAFTSATGGTDRNVTLDTVGGDYGRQKTSFLQQIKDVLDVYAKGQNRDLNDINAYYGGMGDITQSSQNVRQSNTIGDYNQAVGKTQTSKTEGIGSLERALSDYLEQDKQQRKQLATTYQGAQDELANNVQSDIQAKMNVPITLAEQYGGAVPSAYKGQIDRNNSLLNSLQGSTNIFRNFGTTAGKENTSNILKYLYGQG